MKKIFTIHNLLVPIYLLSIYLIALFAYKKPHYNWDMLAYMALVIKKDYTNINQLHQATYKIAKDNIPEIDYEHLIGSEYRKKLSEDPEAFFSKLPFYAIKPLYIKMVSLFYEAGFSLPMSTVLPSIIFYLMIGVLLFYWILKYLKIIWAFAASLLIMLSSFMVFMARLSTPDCMSSFFLLSAFYFIIEKPSIKWMFLFSVLALFARLDNIIPCFFIISFLFFTRKWQMKIKLKYYLLMLIILTCCYFGITSVTMKSFGWNVFYYPTYARYMNLSHTLLPSFSLRAYMSLIFSEITTAIVYYNFTFFGFFLFLILYSPIIKRRNFTFEQLFAFLLLFVILFRFILYPDLSDRFNIAYYLLFMIILLKKYSEPKVRLNIST